MTAYDLHIQLSSHAENAEVKHLQTVAANLGFDGLAIESPKPLAADLVNKSLTIFRRITLTPRSAARLRNHVNKQAKHADLLVIHGRSKPIWLAAVDIPAVHMIMAREIEDFMVIDSQIARVMAKQGKPIEVCLHQLLVLKGAVRSRLMRVMKIAMDHLVRANCSLILTSGAGQTCELRAPQDLEALSYLASVPENLAKNAMNQKTTDLVSRIQGSHATPPSTKSGREG